MKVKELLEDLKKANPEARVVFATRFEEGYNSPIEILSVYSPTVKKLYYDKDGSLSDINPVSKTLYVDLG